MEQSDEEEDYDTAEDVARRARRRALEPVNREEAMRRSAEEERLLAIQTALLSAKSSAAANILSKYKKSSEPLRILYCCFHVKSNEKAVNNPIITRSTECYYQLPFANT